MTYYDEIAEGYEELHGEEQQRKIKLIKAELKKMHWNIKKEDTLLDVACGTGLTTAPWQCKRTGIDPAKKLLEKAKKKYPEIVWMQGVAEQLSFPDTSFDWIISITALQNFDDPEKALLEMKRTGKGKFIISFLKKSDKREISLTV